MGGKDHVQPARGRHAGVLAALSYSVISIAITLFNKAVLSSFSFTSSMTLTLLQGLVTVVCLQVMKRRGWIDMPPLEWDMARRVFPLSFVFIAYVVVSLISLGRVNVPMFTALRRVTVVFVMIEEWYLLGITPSRSVTNTVVVMCLGAAIAAWKDLTFDPVSYFYLFLTNLFTSLYTVYINVVKKETGLNIWAMMYYNNITTMPVLFLIAWWTGDLAAAWNFPHWRSVYFQINFQASVFLAFILNVSTFYCTTLNTARTQTVVGQLKNFVAFLLGLVLFDDYIYDPINFFGLMVGFAGGVLYSWVTYLERTAGGAKAAPPAAATAVAPALGSGGRGGDGAAVAVDVASKRGSESARGHESEDAAPAASGGGSAASEGGRGASGGAGATAALRSPHRAAGDGGLAAPPDEAFHLAAADRGLLRSSMATGAQVGAGGELRARGGV